MNQLASLTASLVLVPGRAKWYAPTLIPFAFALERLVAYLLSRKSVDSVALRNANFLPAAATFTQSIVSCQWLTSMPSM